MEKLKEQFYLIQAELKLKSAPRSTWAKDQVEALKWAEQVFEKMDPAAKEDIGKFQEKLERIERDIDKQNKLVLATHVDFYAIKDEYQQLNDKRKAYQEAFTCMTDQMKSKKQQGEEK